MVKEQEFELKIKKIKQGKMLWNSLVKIYGLENNDYILFFPHMDNEINKIGCKYVQLLINVRKPNKVLILYMDSVVKEKVSNINSVMTKQLSNEEKENLLLCYALTKLTNNFLVVSMTEPYGRCGDKVIKRNGVTIDQVVTYGILGLSKEEVMDGTINCF